MVQSSVLLMHGSFSNKQLYSALKLMLLVIRLLKFIHKHKQQIRWQYTTAKVQHIIKLRFISIIKGFLIYDMMLTATSNRNQSFYLQSSIFTDYSCVPNPSACEVGEVSNRDHYGTPGNLYEVQATLPHDYFADSWLFSLFYHRGFFPSWNESSCLHNLPSYRSWHRVAPFCLFP